MELLARGRRKLFGERITLPLADDMLQAVDANLEKGEPRLAFVRDAIQRELARRAELQSQSRYYLRATLSEVIHGKVFFTVQLRGRDVVVFEANGYRNAANEALEAILSHGNEFSVDVVVVVGTMPGSTNQPEAEDSNPYEAGRTYIRGDDGFEPLNEFPKHLETFDAAIVAMDQSKWFRKTKTPNAETREAMEEARAIMARKSDS
jgi:metal-responsive CopG/Arc/MetJ family transcriptional regulator